MYLFMILADLVVLMFGLLNGPLIYIFIEKKSSFLRDSWVVITSNCCRKWKQLAFAKCVLVCVDKTLRNLQPLGPLGAFHT